MKEQFPSARASTELSRMSSGQAHSLREKAARTLGVGLIASVGSLPDTRPIQASEVQKHLESPNKHEFYLEQGLPSANALLEAGFQIGGQKAEKSLSSQGDALRGYEAPSFAEASTSVETTADKSEGTAETQPEVRVEASQTITETFSNLLVSKEQREQNPVQIYDIFPQVDTQGNIQALYAVARKYTVGDYGTGRYVYKAPFDSQTGRFSSKWIAVSREIPMAASTLAKLEQKMLLGGEDPIRSNNPSILYSEDDGQTLTPLTLDISQGVVRESVVLTETQKAIFSVPGFETSGSLEIFDFNTRTLRKANWGAGSVTTRDGLAAGNANGEIVDLYATVLGQPGNQSGYLKITTNLSTGTSTAERKHTEWGYLNGLFVKKDNIENVTHTLGTNIERQILYVDENATGTVTEMFHYSWLDDWARENGVTDYDNGSLRIWSVLVVGNTVWAATTFQTIDGKGHLAVITWPWGQNPNTDKSILKVFRSWDKSSVPQQGDMLWEHFNDKYTLLINTRSPGLLLIETAADGSPLANSTVLSIDNGVGDLPQPPTPTPTPERPYRVYIPAVFENVITTSWRKAKKLLAP